MEESGTTTIEVTDDEARAFLRFREYQTLFIALLQARVFEVQSGKVIIHFNQKGRIVDIKTYSHIGK